MLSESSRDADVNSTDVKTIKIMMPGNASWWAGIIEDGFKMPLADGYQINLWGNNDQNQVQPLLLSSQGDVVWSQDPFKLQIQRGTMLLSSKSGSMTWNKEEIHCAMRFCMQAENISIPRGKCRMNFYF